MKILAVSAGRHMGNCEILARQALKGAQDCGCEIQFVCLQDYEIRPCTGCEACVNRKLSGLKSRCSIPDEADDLMKYAELIMEADGLILASPCYNLTVAGRMLDALNRKHCFMTQLRERCREKPKYAATIGVGGTDWTNFLMPVLNFAATEYCGSQLNLVDQLLAEFHPAPATSVLDEELMERAYTLGQNLARVVQEKSAGKTYLGTSEEVCPICHGSHLQMRKGKWMCPFCDITCRVTEEDGKIRITWEEGWEKSRFSEYGDRLHLNGIRAGHKRAADNRELIREKIKEFQGEPKAVKP